LSAVDNYTKHPHANRSVLDRRLNDTTAPCAVFIPQCTEKCIEIYWQKWKCDNRNRGCVVSIQSYA